MVAVIDLFAGAGGLGLGAQQAGGDLRLSVEIDHAAYETLEKNAKPQHHVCEGDVTELKGKQLLERADLTSRDPLIVVGGTPCQPFSKASNWVDEGFDHEWRKMRSLGHKAPKPSAPPVRPDSRRTLVDEFARLVIQTKADGFVFENVAALLTKRNKPVLYKMIEEVRAAGYHTRIVKRFASEFGVAQHRERIFVLGSLASKPLEPQPTHWAKSKVAGLKSPTPVREVCKPFASVEFRELEEKITPTETYYEQLNEIDPGRNYKQLTDWADYPSLTGKKSPFIAERRYWNFLLVLHPNKPSWTIPAVYGSWTGPFHWKQSTRHPRRRLRTTEIAAIQGFPVDYEIAGTWRERVRQLGNAVPPAMAAPMVREVIATLYH